MKKYLALLLIFALGGCLEDSIPEKSIEEKNETFILDVPQDFGWSNISAVGMVVNIMNNGIPAAALDQTVLELYDADGVLLDALVVYDGKAEFNVRVPAAATALKVSSPAANYSIDVAADATSVNFEIPDISALSFAREDADSDGLFDAFDVKPYNSDVAIAIDNFQADSNLKSTQGKSTTSSSYVIFEDLWPSKGDYDFNDLVCKTTFSWTRGKSNYIEEITGVCSVEWIGAGLQLGLGFELFEVNGTNLTYMGDVISDMSGASADKSVTNGFVVFGKVQDIGTNEVKFTLEIEDKAFKDFVCIPYLYRTNDKGHQVRPFGAPPTQGQDMSLFRSNDDASPRTWSWDKGDKFKYPLEDSEAFYRSAENHPWGIEFITTNKFKPCEENVSILKSYSGFRDWAETGGKKEKEWYDNPN